MKRTLSLAGLLVIGLALAASTVFPQRGPLTMDIGLFGNPDLAIKKIAVINLLLLDDWVEAEVHVVVRNVGNKSTPPCNVMLNWCGNATAQKPMRTWLERTAEGLDPDENAIVVFEVEVHNYGPAWEGMLIAVADPPLAGKPTGEINEWPLVLQVPGPKPPRAETNNVFGVIFDSGSSITPIRWNNPAL